MKPFQGQVAVVTGGGSGVGEAVAATLLKGGAKVVISGRDEKKLAAAASKLGSAHDVLTVPCDVSDPNQCALLIEAATKQFRKVDILVNNAGANVKNRAIR